MTNRSAFIPAAAISLIMAAACNDRSVSSGPKSPPNPGPVIGMIRGTVDGSTMTATFTPLGNASNIPGGVSAMNYGNQGVTATVFGVVDSTIDVAGVSRTWYVRVALRNLEGFPIGSNYNAAAASDTSGVFLFFTSAPPNATVVTLPSPCACTVKVNNAMGTANFTTPGQQYFWYRSRPTAVQGSPGTDTTRKNPEWQFKTTTFVPPDTAHAFTFVLLVHAAWPKAQEATMTVIYDGTNDSLPDTTAEPRWKKSSLLLPLGTDSWTPAGLVLTAGFGLADSGIYFTRHDSLGDSLTAAMPAYIEAKVQLAAVLTDTIQAVLGLVEHSPAGRQTFIGIASNRVSFATFDNGGAGAGDWSVRGPTFISNGTLPHTYRLRKIGKANVGLCVDGVQVITRTYTQMQAVQSNLNTTTTVFGMKGNALGPATTWTSVSYNLGSDGGGC